MNGSTKGKEGSQPGRHQTLARGSAGLPVREPGRSLSSSPICGVQAPPHLTPVCLLGSAQAILDYQHVAYP